MSSSDRHHHIIIASSGSTRVCDPEMTRCRVLDAHIHLCMGTQSLSCILSLVESLSFCESHHKELCATIDVHLRGPIIQLNNNISQEYPTDITMGTMSHMQGETCRIRRDLVDRLIESFSVEETHFREGRVTMGCDGKYIYMLQTDTIYKLGTGYSGTVAGEIYNGCMSW